MGDEFLRAGRQDRQTDHGPSWPEDVRLTDLSGGRVNEGVPVVAGGLALAAML